MIRPVHNVITHQDPAAILNEILQSGANSRIPLLITLKYYIFRNRGKKKKKKQQSQLSIS